VATVTGQCVGPALLARLTSTWDAGAVDLRLAREPSSVARWSRRLLEYSLFVFGGLWLLNLLRTLVLDSPDWPAAVERVLAYLVFGCLLLAMCAGTVWAAVDLSQRVSGRSRR
jgi:hypothetical protein